MLLFCDSLRPQSNVAVIEFRNYDVSKNEVSALTDRLRTELFRTEKFRVIEREMMQEILNEQGFQQTGCTTDECLVTIGRLIGVEQMIGGSISRVGAVYSVSVRIISVETGEIMGTGTYDYEGDIGNLLRYGMKSVASILAGNQPRESAIPAAPQGTVIPGLKLSANAATPDKNTEKSKPQTAPTPPPTRPRPTVYRAPTISLFGNTMRSIVLPGWGQSVVHKKRGGYYSPAILLCFYLWNNSAEDTYTVKLKFRDGSSEKSPTFSTNSDAQEWQNNFQFDQREFIGSVMSQDIVYNEQYMNAMVTIYVINVLDVVMTTYLYNTEIGALHGLENYELSVRPMPANERHGILLALEYRF